jgi:hypothetical protein
MRAGVAPGKALAKGLMKAPPFMEDTFDIAVCECKRGKRLVLSLGPTGR